MRGAGAGTESHINVMVEKVLFNLVGDIYKYPTDEPACRFSDPPRCSFPVSSACSLLQNNG